MKFINLFSKKVLSVSLIILVLVVAVESVCIFNLISSNTVKLNAQDKQYVQIYQKLYNSSEQKLIKMYDYYGDWTKVGKELLNQKNSISDELADELYKEGVPLSDLSKAMQLAANSRYTAEYIIKEKIKLGSWKDLSKKLNISGSTNKSKGGKK